MNTQDKMTILSGLRKRIREKIAEGESTLSLLHKPTFDILDQIDQLLSRADLDFRRDLDLRSTDNVIDTNTVILVLISLWAQDWKIRVKGLKEIGRLLEKNENQELLSEAIMSASLEDAYGGVRKAAIDVMRTFSQSQAERMATADELSRRPRQTAVQTKGGVAAKPTKPGVEIVNDFRKTLNRISLCAPNNSLRNLAKMS